MFGFVEKSCREDHRLCCYIALQYFLYLCYPAQDLCIALIVGLRQQQPTSILDYHHSGYPKTVQLLALCVMETVKNSCITKNHTPLARVRT